MREICLYAAICIVILGVITYPKWSYTKWGEEGVVRARRKDILRGEYLRTPKLKRPFWIIQNEEEMRQVGLKEQDMVQEVQHEVTS